MSSALSVGKLLLWNLFSFPFSDSTARSPDIHQNYSSLGLFFYDVSLERKTALRRWNNKVIQLWGAFSCATERTRIGTPLIIFGKKPSPSLAHTRTLLNGGGGFGFTHAIFFSPQQNGIPSNVGDLGWIFFLPSLPHADDGQYFALSERIRRRRRNTLFRRWRGRWRGLQGNYQPRTVFFFSTAIFFFSLPSLGYT